MLRNQMMPVALQKLNSQPSATAQNPDVAKAVGDMAGQKATEGARTAGFEADIARGKRAMELASMKHKTGLESREKLAQAGLETSEDIHLAKLGFRERELGAQKEMHDFQLSEGARMSEEAFRIAIPGAILNLGQAWWQNKKYEELVDRYTNEENSISNLMSWLETTNDKLLGTVGERTETYEKAYQEDGGKKKEKKSGGTRTRST